MRREALIYILACFIIVDSKNKSTVIVDLTSNRTQSEKGYCFLQPQREKGSWELSKKREGEVDGFDLKFTCKEGFKLSTPDPDTPCEDYWNLSKAPTCLKLCPQIHATFSTTVKCFDKNNKEIGCDEATDGCYLTYECAPYYEPSFGHDTTIYCSDGRWSDPDPVCQPECGRKNIRHEPLRLRRLVREEGREYPWAAAVFAKIQDDFQNICGGTVISEQMVLTAAHCVTSFEGDVLPEKNYEVAAAVFRNKYRNVADTESQYLNVSRIIKHPLYKGIATNYAIDLAILVTKQRFIFNRFVQPACFTGVNRLNLKTGDVGEVTGWGIIKPEKEPADQLKVLKIRYKSQTTCVAELPPDWAAKYNTVDKLCAGLYKQNSSVCRGDGGGGLLFENKDDNKYYIHGLVSLGLVENSKCNIQTNALYTNVTYFYDFIQRQMLDYSVKQCTLPAYPQNGNWIIEDKTKKPGDVVRSDTELTISCDEGYKLSSNNVKVKCHSSFLIPTCQKLCPGPNVTSSVIMKCVDRNGMDIGCNEATDGSSLTYKCVPLHEPPFGYEATIFCVNGKWNSPGPVCNPICGRRVNNDAIPLVHGGTLLEVIEYPWIVALYRKTEDGYRNICGGTILSQKVLLTAAHCVTNNYGDPLAAENHLVAAGKLYNKYQDPRDPKPQYLEVFRIIPHSSYRANSRHYLADVAILITRQVLVFNFFVHPVCFDSVKSIELEAGNVGVVAGWGATEEDDASDKLRVLEIPYKLQHVCAKELPPDWGDRYNLIDKLCVGLYNQNKSLCDGDSGGGLFYKNRDNRYYLHGIVSLGHAFRGSCDFRQNSLYTKVAFHYDFIYREFSNYHLKECTLPPHPQNGKWVIENQEKKPGDIVSSDTILKVTCDEGFHVSANYAKIKCESAFLMPKCENSTSLAVDSDTEKDTTAKVTCIYDGKGNVTIKSENLNTTLCSYLIFDSVGLTLDGNIKLPQSISAESLQQFVLDLKKKNQNLKILLSVYGSGEESEEYPVIAATAKRRKTFIENVRNFLEEYYFDGLNLHWDVPLIKDRVNYGILIKELRKWLKSEWLLTATVHYSPVNLGYNHVEMYNNLNWFNVECYGLYGAWSLYTGQNAALYPSSVENDFERSNYNLLQCAENWLQYTYKDKLSLGIAFFGRYYTLSDPKKHGIHAPVTGYVDRWNTDRVTYAEICEKYSNWTRVWDDEQKNPYKYYGNKWVGYDDPESIELKVAYIKENGCFGISAFPINGDDMLGKCGPKQILLQRVHDRLSRFR